MPRGKSASSKAAKDTTASGLPRRIQKDDEWGGFVPLQLDEDEKQAFYQWWEEDPTLVRQNLDDSLAAGLKFTLTYDGGNQCYIASLSGRPDTLGQRAFTCCLSARGGTFEEAIAVLIYKHSVRLGGDWWEMVNAPRKQRSVFG